MISKLHRLIQTDSEAQILTTFLHTTSGAHICANPWDLQNSRALNGSLSTASYSPIASTAGKEGQGAGVPGNPVRGPFLKRTTQTLNTRARSSATQRGSLSGVELGSLQLLLTSPLLLITLKFEKRRPERPQGRWWGVGRVGEGGRQKQRVPDSQAQQPSQLPPQGAQLNPREQPGTSHRGHALRGLLSQGEGRLSCFWACRRSAFVCLEQSLYLTGRVKPIL